MTEWSTSDTVNDRVKQMVAPAKPQDGVSRFCLAYLDGTRAPVAVVLDGSSPGPAPACRSRSSARPTPPRASIGIR
jgi:hypothetical protein